MKRTLKIGGAIVAALLVLILGLNLLISANWVEARVASRVMEQTGRELKVNGSTSLMFTPNPHIVITEATITDPAAQKGTADLAVERIAIDLSFSELLSRQIDADRVKLVRPVLTVRLGDKDKVQRTGTAPPLKHAAAKTKPFIAAQTVAVQKTPRREVKLEHVVIEDGAVQIIYDEKGTERRVERINAVVRLPEITATLTAKGKFDWKGETVRFGLELATPAELRASRPAKLQLALDSEAIAARFDGNVSTRPDFAGEGELSAKAHSIPSLLAWMRQGSTSATAIGDGELASHVSWTRDQVSFSKARFALEHAQGQGQAVVTLQGPRPHIRAAFGLERLDLNPFLAKKPNAGVAPNRPPVPPPAEAPAAQVSEAAPGGESAKPKDWFAKPGEGDEAATAPESAVPAQPTVQAPVPATPEAAEAPPPAGPAQTGPGRVAPAAFDADVNLNIRQTRVNHLEIGPSALGLGFRDGVLTATLGGMELYDGHGTGKFVLDATRPVSTFSGKLRLEGVESKALLSDAAQFSMLSGLTKMNLAVSGQGADSEEVRSSLSGQASFVVSDGAIEGVDIAAFLNTLGAGEIPELRQGPGAKTQFSDLGGSFTIANGVAATNNLQMTSPLLKVTAAGNVNLPQSTIDILAHPEIVAAPEGKKGANDLAGITIPVRIAGPLDQPSIKPEIGGLFADPDKTSKTVNQIGDVIRKKFKGKPAGEAIGRFLGNVQVGPREEETEAADEPPPVKRKKRATDAAPVKKRPAPEASEAEQGDGGAAEEPIDPDVEQILR